MILINKQEAEYIRSHFPTSHITMTSKAKKSSRHKYYAEESRKVMQYLAKNRIMKGLNKSIGRV